jgi:hypothetical protein
VLDIPRDGKWEDDVLPQMQKHSTKHFDIYCFPNSTAYRDISTIAEARERGHSAICQFLGTEDKRRIRLIFFEDKTSKQVKTGHQGMGWAFGDTVVEVYNESEQLDPYHETAHILMRTHGNPPALFTEGFAVYMSEYLGAPPLKNLGGGELSLYARVKELAKQGQWITLGELLTYTEIGSEASRPRVSYAQAGAFVKYLIEQSGKDRFLEAYRTLKNSADTQVHRRNADDFKRIYGRSVDQLEPDWRKAMDLSE